ncbi:MAG: hypothetical protein ABEH35_07970 [Haloarculaceae archaeon]
MEFLKYLPGFAVRWECDRCGKRYRNEPTECSDCGNTVYTRVR